MKFLAYANVSISPAISGLFVLHNISHKAAKHTDCTAVGSRMVLISPFFKRRLEALLALYCLKFTKQSGKKWFPHSCKVVGRVAGTLLKTLSSSLLCQPVLRQQKVFPCPWSTTDHVGCCIFYPLLANTEHGLGFQGDKFMQISVSADVSGIKILCYHSLQHGSQTACSTKHGFVLVGLWPPGCLISPSPRIRVGIGSAGS